MENVTVFETWDEPMADMALGLLRAEGIQAFKKDSGLRSTYVISVDGLGEIQIRVPEADAERAREILSARFSDYDPASATDAIDRDSQAISPDGEE